MNEPRPFITFIGKNDCPVCGNKMVGLQIPIQISNLDDDGNPVKWDTIVKLEEHKYCPHCREYIQSKVLEPKVNIPQPEVVQRTRNPFGYL